MSFGVGCLAKSRRPQCDQQRMIPLPINVTPSSQVPDALNVYASATLGFDNSSGLNPGEPVRTIERALEIFREMGYNDSANIWLVSESTTTPTTYTIPAGGCINLGAPLNGNQCGTATLRGSANLTIGTTTFTSAAVGTPTTNYLYRFTVGSTASMQPGYILTWAGGSALVGYVVSGTIVEIAGTTQNITTLPGGGDTITITRPGVVIQGTNSLVLNGSGNSFAIRDIVFGLLSSGSTKTISTRAINTAFTNVIFHNPDDTNIANINFSGTESSATRVAFLGYVYGTSGTTTANSYMDLNFGSGRDVNIALALLDYTLMSIGRSSVSFGSSIFRRTAGRTLVQGGQLNVSDGHYLEFVNNIAAPSTSESILVRDGTLIFSKVYYDALSPTNAWTGRLFRFENAGISTMNNTSVLSNTAGISIFNLLGTFLDYSPQAGPSNQITATYPITSNTTVGVFILTGNSSLRMDTLANNPLTVTTTGTGPLISLNRSAAQLTGIAGTGLITLTTAGTIGVTAANVSLFSMTLGSVNGSTTEFAVNGNSSASINTVTSAGAGAVDVGTLGAVATPAAGQVIVNVTTVNTASAGDGSSFANL